MRFIITLLLLFLVSTVKSQKFDTEITYTDAINKGIQIQNSYPKGGLKYTSPDGKKYIYAIFWTQITNTTINTLTLSINFPSSSFTHPSAPSTFFNLYVPSTKMNPDNDAKFNYGLDLKPFLDKNYNKSTKLQTEIKPKSTYQFYVVTLYNQGVNGVLRAKFELQNQLLQYKISGNEINCGSLVPKN